MITIKYVGHERWKTAEAAREYHQEAEIRWGGGALIALMSDEDVAELVATGQAYLAARAASHIEKEGEGNGDLPEAGQVAGTEIY